MLNKCLLNIFEKAWVLCLGFFLQRIFAVEQRAAAVVKAAFTRKFIHHHSNASYHLRRFH